MKGIGGNGYPRRRKQARQLIQSRSRWPRIFVRRMKGSDMKINMMKVAVAGEPKAMWRATYMLSIRECRNHRRLVSNVRSKDGR
jgi:hypothetical protein